MSDPSNIDVEPGIPTNAVSLVDDTAEEFPVLKAFQQYIDAEQNKARKRMLSLCIFFGCLMTLVIIVFVILLNGVSLRNQALNDRLIEYVMKERDRQSAVVVQQTPSDQSTMYLTAKIDEMQKKLEQAQQKADAMESARKEAAAKAATEAAIEAEKQKAKLREEIEVTRLKAQLAAEREKAAAERENKRQEELEAYRRKHYPELYEKPQVKPQAAPAADPEPQKPAETTLSDEEEKKVDQEISNLLSGLNDAEAISYFDEEDENGKPLKTTQKDSPSKPASYSIPVEVKGKRSKWLIPNN